MSAKTRRKARAIGERPRLGMSTHLRIQLSQDIIARSHEKGISLKQAEKEVVAGYKKRYK